MSEFRLQLKWSGSTASPQYSRNAIIQPEGKPGLETSASSVHKGDDKFWNPEDLFGASLAMCHFLTFLSLANKFKIDVTNYLDHITVTLEQVDKVIRVTKVRLAPEITIAKGHDLEKTRMAFEKSHQYCFIGNSITSEVIMEPMIREAN